MTGHDVDESAEAIVTRAARAFEAAWRQWGPPKIKFYLRDVRPDCRQIALLHLVRLDLEHRMRLGERPSPVRYAEQFPRIFGSVTPERRELDEAIRRLLAHGPPAAPTPPASGEADAHAAPVPPPPPAAPDDDPSDWIESLGSEYASEPEPQAGEGDAAAGTAPVTLPARRRRSSPTAPLIVTALVLLAVGSLVYVIAQATHEEGGSAAVPASAPSSAPPVKPVPPVVAPPTPSSADAAPARVIDLMPMVAPSVDVAGGKWTRSAGGAIDSDNDTWAMLRIPYRPPEEYDLEVEFERLPGGTGGASTGLVGSARRGSLETSFEWNVWLDPQTCGFWLIDGKPWREGPPEARGAVAPNGGGKHTARLSVRREGVEGYLDGVRVAGWKTDFQDLTLPHADEWGGPVTLGLRTYENPTRFFVVKLTEWSGEGRPLRR